MNINELYQSVTEEVAAEKTASDVNADQAPEFNAEFFEKIANNDEESVAILNEFVDESRAEGYTDEQIENGIVLAMQEAGVETGEIDGETVADGETGETVTEVATNEDVEDEFEQAKAAQFIAGAEKGLEDSLNSELAKKAGVTMEDLEKVELGQSFGEGYAQTREAIDPIVEKIAAAREEQAKEASEDRVRQNVLSKIAMKGEKDKKDDKDGMKGKDYMMAMLKKHRGKK